MRLSRRQIIQVLLSFLVATGIFWFLYKDLSFGDLKESFQEASLFLILLSILVSILGYWLRAWRWKLLINTGKKKVSGTYVVFVALMLGYLTNLLLPRAGELARCAALQKTENQPMGGLLGTVVLERSIDLLFLTGTVFLAFLLEKDTFIHLFQQLVAVDSLFRLVQNYAPVFIGGVVVFGILVYWLYQRYRNKGLVKKSIHFLREFGRGLVSVREVKNQWGFWASTVAIWIIYFLMMYFVALGIPSTSHLDKSAVLMVMVMGSIGMIAPVQGGIGTFHALVAFILIVYGLTEDEGKIFAIIVHGSQVLTVLVAGIWSLLFLTKIINKKKPINQ